MSHKCPDCSADVPGVVTQTILESRLNSQKQAFGAERDLLTARVTTAEQQAAGFEGVKVERDAALADIARRDSAAAQRSALGELSIPVAMDETVGILYRSAVAGLDDAGRPSFSDWLNAEEGGARSNPLLAPLFVAGASDAAAAAAVPSAAARLVPPAGFPSPDRGAKPSQPGVPQGRLTPGQIRSHLQGMSSAEVATWRAQNGDGYGWAAPVEVA
jgi:hypothetical protein